MIHPISKAQKKLVEQYGTPAEFARAVYEAVPGEISMDEARAAVEKYGREWEAARIDHGPIPGQP